LPSLPLERTDTVRNKLSLVVAALLATTTFCLAQTDATSKSKARGAATGHSDQMLIDNSRATWEAYKSRNVAAIKALTAEDYVSYTQEGPSNLKQDVETIGRLTIESFTIDEPKVSWATKDVAILRYKCNLKGSFDGKPFKPIYATEVWVNRGGKWRIVSYQETPLS
jgi:ketosteroid isomerase-like protein